MSDAQQKIDKIKFLLNRLETEINEMKKILREKP